MGNIHLYGAILRVYILLTFLQISITMGPCSGFGCLTGCSRPTSIESRGIAPIKPRASYSLGQMVQYKCLEDLVPQGGSTFSRCLQDNTWSQPKLRCILQCSPIQEFAHTVHDGGSAGQDSGSVVMYHCEEGYSGVGSREMSYKCDNNGKWALIDEQLECKKTCPELNITHGIVESQGPIFANSTFKVTCAVGYVLKGSAIQTCAESGNWTEDKPQCLVVDCGEPIIPDGSCEGTDGTTYNANFSCSCNPGYHLNGSANIRCTQLVEWSPGLPVCIKDVNIRTTSSTLHPIHMEISSNNTMQVQVSENGTTSAPNGKHVRVKVAMAASVGAYLLLVTLISIGFLVNCLLKKSKQEKKKDQKGIYDQVTQQEETV